MTRGATLSLLCRGLHRVHLISFGLMRLSIETTNKYNAAAAVDGSKSSLECVYAEPWLNHVGNTTIHNKVCCLMIMTFFSSGRQSRARERIINSSSIVVMKIWISEKLFYDVWSNFIVFWHQFCVDAKHYLYCVKNNWSAAGKWFWTKKKRAAAQISHRLGNFIMLKCWSRRGILSSSTFALLMTFNLGHELRGRRWTCAMCFATQTWQAKSRLKLIESEQHKNNDLLLAWVRDEKRK